MVATTTWIIDQGNLEIDQGNLEIDTFYIFIPM